MLKLEWSNVDLENGFAKLVRTKTAAEEVRQLPNEAIEVLRLLPRTVGCPFVFPGRDSRSRLKSVRKPWVDIRKKAGLSKLEGLGPFRGVGA